MKLFKPSTIAPIVIIGSTLLFIGWMIFDTSDQHSEIEYGKALEAQDSSDPCATPSDYTDEEWYEHMSHHPEMYEDCL